MSARRPGPSRISPQLPAHAMQTYRLLRPTPTHWRAATCAEADCPQHQQGWRTEVDEGTELGQQQAHYIRAEAGRRFVEERHPVARITAFIFEAGQRCFASHQIPLEREPLYVVQGGDWRGNPRGVKPRVHSSAEAWVDDFGTHQNTLADRLAQG